MKNSITRILLLSLILTSFTSCEAIAGIFKAGMGFGIFIVLAILVAIIFVVSKMMGKK